MPQLTPVDFDPFAQAGGGGVKLTPVDHNPFADSGVVASFQQGLANELGGFGETQKQTIGGGDRLKGAAQAVAPTNYNAPHIYDEQGLHLGNIPSVIAENLPSMATSLAVARMVPGGIIPKALAGAAVYGAQAFGNNAKQRAINDTGNPNAEPTTQEKLAALPGTALAAGAGALGTVPFFGPVVKGVGAAGAKAALGRFAETVGTNAVTGGAQNFATQVGNTLGTNKGLTVDPYQVGDAAIGGGLTAGVLKAPGTAADIYQSARLRNFGGAQQQAAASVANDIITNTPGGLDALKPSIFSPKYKLGGTAVAKAEEQNQIELANQITALKQQVTLPSAAEGALSRAVKGEPLDEADHEAIANAVAGQPNGDLVSFLARKAAVFPELKATGDFHNGKFSGGLSSKLFAAVRHNIGKTALVGAIGGGAAEHAGGHLIAYSPEMIAAMTGGALGSRMLGKFTGSLNPAYNFASRLSNPVGIPGINNPPPPSGGLPPNMGPWGAIPPGTPGGVRTVPTVTPSPNGPLRQPPPGFNSLVRDAVRDQNKSTRQASRIAKLAAKEAFKQGAHLIGDALGGPVGGAIGHGLAGVITGLGEQNEGSGPNSVVILPSGPMAAGKLGPGGIPNTTLAQTKKMVLGLQAMQKAKQKQLGQNYADTVAEKSPLLATIGGPGVVANPAAGQRMAQMVSAATAYRKLTAGANPILDQTTPQTVTKGNGQIAVNNEPFPRSAYAHLPPDQAAHQITSAAEKAGNLKYAGGFRSSTQENITAQRSAIDRVGAEVPELNTIQLPDGMTALQDLKARLEGVQDQATAKAFREHFKQVYPQAAAALDKYLSDDAIEGKNGQRALWRRKGQR